MAELWDRHYLTMAIVTNVWLYSLWLSYGTGATLPWLNVSYYCMAILTMAELWDRHLTSYGYSYYLMAILTMAELWDRRVWSYLTNCLTVAILTMAILTVAIPTMAGACGTTTCGVRAPR